MRTAIPNEIGSLTFLGEGGSGPGSDLDTGFDLLDDFFGLGVSLVALI